MTRILFFIIIGLVGFVIVKFLIKITSFLIKVIVWLAIFGFGIYVVNYYVLPKFNKNPYDIKAKLVDPAKFKTKNIVSEIDKKIVPQTTKTVKKVKDLIKQEIGETENKKNK